MAFDGSIKELAESPSALFCRVRCLSVEPCRHLNPAMFPALLVAQANRNIVTNRDPAVLCFVGTAGEAQQLQISQRGRDLRRAESVAEQRGDRARFEREARLVAP